jgi:hypothetical protein
MKILVQVLHLQRDNSYNNKMIYVVDDNLTEELKTISKGKKRLDELKLLHNNSQIRLLEYHNDEPDNIRKPCKVLQVSD